MYVAKSLALAGFVVGLLLGTGTARAIDASDVLDRMEPRERSMFIAGAVDMASHIYAVDGKRAKADCAIEWLFDQASSKREVLQFFETHRDKDAVGLLSILIDRNCED